MSVLDSKQYVSKIKDGGVIRKQIPSGMYEIVLTMEELYLTKKEVITDKLIDMPGSESDKILQEINTFMSDETKRLYGEYGSVYKKGFLLHGKPGTGKSIVSILAAQKLIEQKDAVVFFNPTPDAFKMALESFKDELQDRLILLIMEEFETVYNQYQESTLSLLDGESQISNFITIACTNYIEQLPERIKSRPSRFSTILEITPPNVEIRRIFVKSKLLERDMDKLEAIVDATEGFTVDQLKDVILSTCVYNISIPDAIRKIQTMQENSLGEENIKSHFTNNYVADIKRELGNFTKVLRKR